MGKNKIGSIVGKERVEILNRVVTEVRLKEQNLRKYLKDIREQAFQAEETAGAKVFVSSYSKAPACANSLDVFYNVSKD